MIVQTDVFNILRKKVQSRSLSQVYMKIFSYVFRSDVI